MSFAQKETVARLERLPPGLEFPATFPEPIRFDPERRGLESL